MRELDCAASGEQVAFLYADRVKSFVASHEAEDETAFTEPEPGQSWRHTDGAISKRTEITIHDQNETTEARRRGGFDSMQGLFPRTRLPPTPGAWRKPTLLLINTRCKLSHRLEKPVIVTVMISRQVNSG